MNEYRSICGKCRKVIVIKEAIFPIVNDKSIVLLSCNVCSTKYFLRLNNGNESHFEGAKKLDVYDCENQRDLITADIYPSYPELDKEVEILGQRNQTKSIYNVSSSPIFICNICQNNLELLAFEHLTIELDEIKKEYQRSIAYLLKKAVRDWKYAICKLNIDCVCNHQYTAVFYTKLDFRGDVPQNVDEFFIAEVIGAELKNTLDGIFSKSDCLIFLEKLIYRWSLMYNEIHLVTPFFGHFRMSDEKIIDLWDWMLKQVDPTKIKLITKTSTFNTYKKKLKNLGQDFEFLRKYDLISPVLKKNKTKENFHAKYYAGVSSDHVEVLSGSLNILAGPSFENISFNTYTREEYKNKYLRPLEIDIIERDEYVHHILIEKNAGTWSSRKLENGGNKLVI